jgi:hypothetical protein
MASGVYHSGLKRLTDGTIDFLSDTIRCALLDTSHSFSDDDDTWDDVSANEVSGTGYTADGVELTTKTIIDSDANDAVYYDADNPEWLGATLSNVRHAVIYEDTGTPSTSYLICSLDFGETFNISSSSFTIMFDSNGFMKGEDNT